MAQPTQDLRIALPVPSGGTITPFCLAYGPLGVATGSYPPNDDSRFPYKPRRLHATGFQFDVVALRRLPDDYAAGVLDDLGTPILDEYGAPIR